MKKGPRKLDEPKRLTSFVICQDKLLPQNMLHGCDSLSHLIVSHWEQGSCCCPVCDTCSPLDICATTRYVLCLMGTLFLLNWRWRRKVILSGRANNILERLWVWKAGNMLCLSWLCDLNKSPNLTGASFLEKWKPYCRASCQLPNTFDYSVTTML